MPASSTTEGSIVAYLRLDSSDWDAKLDAAEQKARDLGRIDPNIRVTADTAASAGWRPFRRHLWCITTSPTPGLFTRTAPSNSSRTSLRSSTPCKDRRRIQMPGSIIANMPPRDDDIQRRQRDAERRAREQASAKSGQAMQIGAGGIDVTDGGSITIEGTGALHVGSGALDSAGSITAGTDITAGGTVQGADVVSTGGASVAGALSAESAAVAGDISAANLRLGNLGTLYSSYAYNNPVTVSYLAAYINGPDGRLGATPSAARFKQDVTPKTYTAAEAGRLSALVVNYRLIAAVKEYGAAAPVEVGVVAESLISAGFPEFVAFDENGNTLSVHYERLSLVVMAAFAEVYKATTTQAAQIADLQARLTKAGIA